MLLTWIRISVHFSVREFRSLRDFLLSVQEVLEGPNRTKNVLTTYLKGCSTFRLRIPKVKVKLRFCLGGRGTNMNLNLVPEKTKKFPRVTGLDEAAVAALSFID